MDFEQIPILFRNMVFTIKCCQIIAILAVLSIVDRKKITLCSNSTMQQCYNAAAIAAICQYCVLNSVLQNNTGLLKFLYDIALL